MDSVNLTQDRMQWWVRVDAVAGSCADKLTSLVNSGKDSEFLDTLRADFVTFLYYKGPTG